MPRSEEGPSGRSPVSLGHNSPMYYTSSLPLFLLLLLLFLSLMLCGGNDGSYCGVGIRCNSPCAIYPLCSVLCACDRINTSLVQINGMCLSPTLVAKASSSTSSHFSFGPAATTHSTGGGMIGSGGGIGSGGSGGLSFGGGFYGGGVRCGGRTTEPVRRSRSQGGQRNKLQKCLSTVSYSDDGLAVANTRATLCTAVDRHNLLATRQYCSFGSTNRHYINKYILIDYIYQ